MTTTMVILSCLHNPAILAIACQGMVLIKYIAHGGNDMDGTHHAIGSGQAVWSL